MGADRAVSTWSKVATYDATGEFYTFSPPKSFDRWDLRFINDSANTMTWTIEALDVDGDAVAITNGGSAYTTAGNSGLDITIQSTHIYQVKVTCTGTSPNCKVKVNAYRDLDGIFNTYGSSVAAST
jgi:hypothetical protein